MKKLMYIAAALLVLVGCQKKENVIENTPQNLVTITGGIDFSAQDGPNKVAVKGDWVSATTGSEIHFKWEEGDKIAVLNLDGTDIKEFTVSEISQDGETAVFTGEALSGGMANYYYAIYPYEYGEKYFTDLKSFFANQQYSEKLKPYIFGMGQNSSFTMNVFSTIFDLSLTGSDKLGKIVYHIDNDGQGNPYDATLSFGDGGFQLTDQSQHVTFTPYVYHSDGFKLSFYDTNNQLIMEKKSEKSLTLLGVGNILSFPTLEVKDPYNGHDYVDLGLSVKWATMNVGATTPEGYGDYFAWGETATKSDYSWGSYKYMQSGQSGWQYITKYTYPDNQMNGIWYSDGTFIGDNKTVLELADDAAVANWKGAWRMPTYAELDELKTNCTWTWTQKNGINGYEVKGPNNNTIFLPAAGYYSGSSLSKVGSYGYYWSSSLYESSSDYAYRPYFYSDAVGWGGINRSWGQPVRPVVK